MAQWHNDQMDQLTWSGCSVAGREGTAYDRPNPKIAHESHLLATRGSNFEDPAVVQRDILEQFMINQTISHYPAFRNPVQRDKILEKSRPELCSGRGCSFRRIDGTALGEVPKSPTSVFQSRCTGLRKAERVVATLRISRLVVPLSRIPPPSGIPEGGRFRPLAGFPALWDSAIGRDSKKRNQRAEPPPSGGSGRRRL